MVCTRLPADSCASTQGDDSSTASSKLSSGKVYTGKQILKNYEVYATRRNITDKLAGSIINDAEGRELYLGHAREDRSALWLRLPAETDVPKALRMLADFRYVHTRYCGPGKQQDLRV